MIALPPTVGLFAIGCLPSPVTWNDLFERAASYDVSTDDVLAALRERRDERT